MSEKSLLPDFRKYEIIREYQIIRPGGALFYSRMYLFQISGNIRPERHYQANHEISGLRRLIGPDQTTLGKGEETKMNQPFMRPSVVPFVVTFLR
jgi:hypothetical protein